MRDRVRYYSRLAIAKGFQNNYIEIQEACGQDAYPFFFQLAMDRVPVASGGILGNQSITPLYLSCLQVSYNKII
jgi:hypothetical protein